MDSSDEEVFNRRRKDKKTELSTLFSSSSTEEYVSYDQDSNAMQEIFGTGEEYQYINEEEAAPKDTPMHTPKAEKEAPNVDELCEWVYEHAEGLTYQHTRDIVGQLVQHLSPYFISLHCCINTPLKNVLRIKERIHAFGVFKKMKHQAQLRTADPGLLRMLDRINSMEGLLAFNRYVPVSDACMDEAVENVYAMQRIHSVEWKGDVGRLVQHPLFVEGVSRIRRSGRGVRSALEELIGTCVCVGVGGGCTSACGSISGSVSSNHCASNNGNAPPNAHVPALVADILLNSCTPINPNELAMGVLKDKGTLKAAVLNYNGEELSTRIYRDTKGVLEMYEEYAPAVVAVSGDDVAVRSVYSRIKEVAERTFMVDPLLMCHCEKGVIPGHDAGRVHSVNLEPLEGLTPADVVRRLIHPEVLVANGLLRKADPLVEQGLKMAMAVVGVDVNFCMASRVNQALLRFVDVEDPLGFIREVEEYGWIGKLEVLRGMLGEVDFKNACVYLRVQGVGVGVGGVDGVQGRDGVQGVGGVQGMGGSQGGAGARSGAHTGHNTTQHTTIPATTDHTLTSTLTSTQHTTQHTTHSTQHTPPPGDILDATAVHPVDYPKTRMLCAACLDYEELDDENPSAAVEEVLRSRNKLSVFEEGVVDGIASLLRGYTRAYHGLPDKAVFRMLTGDALTGVHEGRVVRAEEECYWVRVKGVDVCVQGASRVNEIVAVEVCEERVPWLGYAGVAQCTKAATTLQHCFEVHALFLPLSAKQAERHLEEHGRSVLLRMSSQGSYGVLTLRLAKGIYTHIKVEEAGTSLRVNNTLYDDLNEVVSVLAKRILRNIRSVKMHPKYVEEGVSEYLRQSKSSVPYCFVLSGCYPGKVEFCYQSDRVKKEYLSVWEKFVYEKGKRVFNDLDEFLRYRKSL